MAGLTRTIQVRLPQDVYDAIDVQARQAGVRMSRVVRGYIDVGLSGAGRVVPDLSLLDEPPVDVTAMDAWGAHASALPGVPVSALPAPGMDPVVAEVVGDAPKHYHRREQVGQQMVNGVLVKAYRCGTCGVSLT